MKPGSAEEHEYVDLVSERNESSNERGLEGAERRQQGLLIF